MIAKTFSATLLGIDAYLIEVEVDVSVGMSVFNINDQNGFERPGIRSDSQSCTDYCRLGM